jgi:hypothetical protein
MSKPGAILILALAACTAGAQQKPSVETEPPVPKSLCRSERLSAVRQVKADPPIEELMRFDQSLITEHRVFFRKGSIVTVSRYDGYWACVTGPFERPTSGSPFRTGWMKTALLGPVEQEPASGIDHR